MTFHILYLDSDELKESPTDSSTVQFTSVYCTKINTQHSVKESFNSNESTLQ